MAIQLMSTDTLQDLVTWQKGWPSSVKNQSSECIIIRFREMEYLPWNNADTIVSLPASDYARKFRYVMLLILFLIGAPANVINMAVWFHQSLRDRVNLCLFSLSLADWVYLVATLVQYGEDIYLELSSTTKAGTVLKFMVNHHLTVFHAFSYVSFVLSAIIACERCYCVLRPLKYQSLLSTKAMAAIILAVFVTVLSLYFVVVLRYFITCAYDPDYRIETVLFTHSQFYTDHKDLIENLDSVFFGVGLPGGITVVLITTTAITTTRLRQAMAWRSETSTSSSSFASSSTSSMSQREVSLTRMLIGTSILLIVCLSPSCLFRIACLFLPELNTGRRNQNLYLVCMWTAEVFLFINSSFNIFIYFAMGSRYRDTLKALCGGRRRRRRKALTEK